MRYYLWQVKSKNPQEATKYVHEWYSYRHDASLGLVVGKIEKSLRSERALLVCYCYY